MKQLIAATLTEEATEVWNNWPKKNKLSGEIGRSARLSKLLEESGSMPAHIEALKLREGNLLATLAECRQEMIQFIRFYPLLEGSKVQKLGLIIDDIQDKTHGTIFFNYGISKDYLKNDEK